jgi:hypothetical protein
MRTKLPIPEPQGNTPMERLDWAFRTVLKVPKAALVKNEKKRPLATTNGDSKEQRRH